MLLDLSLFATSGFLTICTPKIRGDKIIFPPRIFERILLAGFSCEDVPFHIPIIPVPVPLLLRCTPTSYFTFHTSHRACCADVTLHFILYTAYVYTRRICWGRLSDPTLIKVYRLQKLTDKFVLLCRLRIRR